MPPRKKSKELDSTAPMDTVNVVEEASVEVGEKVFPSTYQCKICGLVFDGSVLAVCPKCQTNDVVLYTGESNAPSE